MKGTTITFVGTLPPPVHGMAIANESIIELLEREGMKIHIHDTSPPAKGTTLSKHLDRIKKHLLAWMGLLAKGEATVVYLALSGGLGLIYDVITVALCRARGLHCILHHHAWQYLAKPNFLLRAVTRFAGKDVVHIVLCERMAERLTALYHVKNPLVLSNAFLLQAQLRYGESAGEVSDLPARPRFVGMLSNLTYSKGTDAFLKIAEASHAAGLRYKFILAGPCAEETLCRKIIHAQEKGTITWLGPIYGPQKAQFYKSIDAFIFPSRYAYEAEPIVLWEALSHGLPVITTPQGCVPGQVADAGFIVGSNHPEIFVKEAIKVLETWQRDDSQYRRLAISARERLEGEIRKCRINWRKLIAHLQSGYVTDRESYHG